MINQNFRRLNASLAGVCALPRELICEIGKFLDAPTLLNLSCCNQNLSEKQLLNDLYCIKVHANNLDWGFPLLQRLRVKQLDLVTNVTRDLRQLANLGFRFSEIHRNLSTLRISKLSYLHMNHNLTEIGFNHLAHLRVLTGVTGTVSPRDVLGLCNLVQLNLSIRGSHGDTIDFRSLTKLKNLELDLGCEEDVEHLVMPNSLETLELECLWVGKKHKSPLTHVIMNCFSGHSIRLDRRTMRSSEVSNELCIQECCAKFAREAVVP